MVRQRPLNEQALSLHRRILPRAYWIERSRIALESDVRNWRHPHHGFVVDGDWDLTDVWPRPSIHEQATVASAKTVTHETIRDLFVHRKDHREAEQYRLMTRAVLDGRSDRAYGCQTLDEVEAYFERLRRTHDTMRREGYRTQHDLGLPYDDEIKLYLTRDGRLVHGNGGNHRFRIAELLEITWVPVIIAGCHLDWVIARCQASGVSPRHAIQSWVDEQLAVGVLRRERPDMAGPPRQPD